MTAHPFGGEYSTRPDDLAAITEAVGRIYCEDADTSGGACSVHFGAAAVWVAEHVRPLLDRARREGQAEAWDEGHAAPGNDQNENWGRWPGTPLVETRNPYRSAVSGESEGMLGGNPGDSYV